MHITNEPEFRSFYLCLGILRNLFNALAMVMLSTVAFANNPFVATAQPVRVQTTDGNAVCNTSGAFSQIPGQPDFFVGRGLGIGTIEECHKPIGHGAPFLALYKMDWQSHILVMQHYLVKPPVKTPTGVDLRSAYDPYVALYKGDLWVAFECTVPGAVSSCVAPLAHDLSSLDLFRFSIAVEGKLGPHGPHGQVVGLLSASAPILFPYQNMLFLYWQADYFDNQLPENHLISRGMQLEEDTHGRLWSVGSSGKPVLTDDPHLTSLVHDVRAGDQTADHVAATSDVVVVGQKILEFSSVGGTGGRQTCRSTHDDSPGCWRMALSLSDKPVGPNVFGQHELSGVSLPAEVIEYPRLIVDPAGHHFLMGNFQPPVGSPIAGRATTLKTPGLQYAPFEPKDFLQ